MFFGSLTRVLEVQLWETPSKSGFRAPLLKDFTVNSNVFLSTHLHTRGHVPP
jgi:hypothetical protein